MITLGIDCATTGCSIAIINGTETLYKDQTEMSRNQSEKLIPQIELAIKETGLDFKDLNLIGVTIGPGSFTGIRVGIAAARGYGLGLNIPIIGINLFDVFLEQMPPVTTDKLIAINSKRAEPFYQIYNQKNQSKYGPDQKHWPDILKKITDPITIYGDGHSQQDLNLPNHISALEPDLPDPIIVAKLAQQKQDKPGDNIARPYYIRSADVTVKDSKNA